jgi:hypothetical protein
MIVKKQKITGLVIDLTGPQGNGFALLGLARQLSKEMGLDEEEILNKMQSGDYENLIQAFDSYFGDFVTLLR